MVELIDSLKSMLQEKMFKIANSYHKNMNI